MVEWDRIAAARPDVVVVMPCGMYVDEAREEAVEHGPRFDSLGPSRIVAVDAAASFSRPGPRLADGTELLAHVLHPDRVQPPEGLRWQPVASGARIG